MNNADAPIGLIDLDGTLADFDGAMLKAMVEIAGPGETEEDLRSKLLRQDDEPDYIKARRRLIKSRPGFWGTLPRLELGFQVLEVMNRLGFVVNVLTNGPRQPASAWEEKKQWCDIHLPGVPVIIGRNKGLVYGRVLVDDWPEYILKWLEWRPRGQVIMPAHPWNVDFKHPNVLRYDGSNYAEMTEVLSKAASRKAGVAFDVSEYE